MVAVCVAVISTASIILGVLSALYGFHLMAAALLILELCGPCHADIYLVIPLPPRFLSYCLVAILAALFTTGGLPAFCGFHFWLLRHFDLYGCGWQLPRLS